MLKRIVTHSGAFHCDESLACFLLHQTSQFAGAEIVRSRDPAVIDTGDVVVDVGAVYDPSRHRYDHHQRSFTDTMNEKYQNTRLSSAGLIYKHFGREVLSNRYKENDPKVIEVLYWKIYENFIEEIDAIDNGVTQFEGKGKYTIHTSLSSRVSRLNPRWNDPSPDYDGQFKKAVQITGEEFTSIADNYYYGWLPARTIVEEAIDRASEVHPSKKIILLKQSCPWADHLFNLETEKNIEGQVIYVIYGADGDWRVQAVPDTPGSFNNRKALPESWRGKRDEELSKESGIPDCVFIHASGFIGGNKTQEGAFRMATAALETSAV